MRFVFEITRGELGPWCLNCNWIGYQIFGWIGYSLATKLVSSASRLDSYKDADTLGDLMEVLAAYSKIIIQVCVSQVLVAYCA